MSRTVGLLLKRGSQVFALVAAGILAALMIGIYEENKALAWLPPGRWLALAVYTLLVFGSAVHEFRRSWNRSVFWLCLLGLLLAHATAYGAALSRIEAWRIIWFLPITAAEIPAVFLILQRLGFDEVPQRRRALDGTRYRR